MSDNTFNNKFTNLKNRDGIPGAFQIAALFSEGLPTLAAGFKIIRVNKRLATIFDNYIYTFLNPMAVK